MRAVWTEMKVEPEPGFGLLPGEELAVAYRGLSLVPVYDVDSQCIFGDMWELRHVSSGTALMLVKAETEELALAYATRITDFMEWDTFADPPGWNDAVVPAALREFIREHQDVLLEQSLPEPYAAMMTEIGDDIDEIVPFG